MKNNTMKKLNGLREREEDRTKKTEQQEWEDIELKEVESSLKKSHKWKSPGLDKLPNFWLNILL